jgi:cytochrome c556
MKSLFLAVAVSFIATSALADPIEDRKAIMKERADVMQVLVPIAQGKQPFDAAVVMEQLEKLNANAQSVDVQALWPEGSDTGDTRSLPKIWEDMEGFTAAHEKFKADTAAAVEANPQDLEAFRAVMGTVGGNCGSCHEAYRRADS